MRKGIMRWLVPGLLFLGLELMREWTVLNFMGFEPGRFVQYVRGDDVGAR